MICFPNAKINLGLNVVEKRNDGFHNLETIFYPIGWHDTLEITESKDLEEPFKLSLSGIKIAGAKEDNLLYKAYELIKKQKNLPSINVHLQKNIPMGAGLGGGSADAAFFINLLDNRFSLNLSEETRIDIAKQLGSDCAFFINNKPVFASEKGDVFSELNLDLSPYYIAVIFPDVHSNTKDAYSLIKPQFPQRPVLEVIRQPIETWKDYLINDFETSIFKKYPEVQKVKQDLYDCGALYASMSGSGSAVYGLFKENPMIKHLDHFPHWVGKMMS